MDTTKYRIGNDSENGYWVFKPRHQVILCEEDLGIVEMDLTKEEAEALVEKLNREDA